MTHFIRNFCIFVASWAAVIFLIPRYPDWMYWRAPSFISDNFDVTTIGTVTILLAIAINILLLVNCYKKFKLGSQAIRVANLSLGLLILAAIIFSLLFLLILNMYYHGIG